MLHKSNATAATTSTDTVGAKVKRYAVIGGLFVVLYAGILYITQPQLFWSILPW